MTEVRCFSQSPRDFNESNRSLVEFLEKMRKGLQRVLVKHIAVSTDWAHLDRYPLCLPLFDSNVDYF